MTYVNANNNAALAILKSGQSGASAAGFLASGPFSANSDSILDAISSAFKENKSFQQQFSTKFAELTEEYKKSSHRGFGETHPDNVKHNALAYAISENREAFPPEEIVLHTDLPDGASISTTIPALVYFKVEILEKGLVEKQEQYDASIAPETEPDQATIKLNALSKVVETLVLDKQDSTLVLFEETETQADFEEDLAKPFLEN